MHFFTQRGTPTQRTNNLDGNILGSRRGGSLRRCLTPPTAALLWVWIGISALVVPGAWSFLSEEQEEMLVELHNHYRGQVSPTASAMMPLRWDPSLKVIAEGYAAKCVWNHNPELEETGENLFAGTGPLDLREAMEKWFLERLDYDYQNNSCDDEKMCGHYTQMVWADTHRVGCAFHLCNNMEGLDWERVSYLVCNYYPAGNYEDERPYVEGDWCSSCPENLQKCENNLCVADTEDDEEEDEGEGEEGEIEDGGEIEMEDGTVVPPAATSEPEPEPEPDQDTDPSVQTELGQERDEDEILLPAATTEPYGDHPTTSSLDLDSAESTAPEPNAHTPNTPTTSPGEGDESEEIEEIEIEEIEMEEIEISTDKPVVTKKGREMAGNILKEVAQAGAGSMLVPSILLLVCLTGILTLRL